MSLSVSSRLPTVCDSATHTLAQELASSSVVVPDATPGVDLALGAAKKQEAVNFAALSAKQIENKIIQEIIGTHFVIDAAKVEELTKCLGISHEDLLRAIVPVTKPFARPPISGYHVGVAGLGKSGNIYLGVNLEFTISTLSATVHGEQFLVANARNHGEAELEAIAISAAPCGHCRQFLNELGGKSDLKIFFQKPAPGGKTADVSTKLSDLLPESFGPQDLGLEGGLLTPKEFVKSDHANPLSAKAIDAAHASYAPFSKSFSGVAIRTGDGAIYSGSYLENAAFNPSLSPMQTALVALVAAGRLYDEIQEVVLAENPSDKISQAANTNGILRSIAPRAMFRVECLKD